MPGHCLAQVPLKVEFIDCACNPSTSYCIGFMFISKNDFIWNRNAFKHELEVLEKVRHPNVVQFVGAVTQNIPMMIVSEYHPKVNSPYLFILNCFSNCIWGEPKKYCCFQTLYLYPFMHNFAYKALVVFSFATNPRLIFKSGLYIN